MDWRPLRWQRLLELWKKRVVLLFLADRGQWPMAGTDDRVVGQAKNVFAVGAQSGGEGKFRPTYRSREQGIPNDGEWVGEAFDDKGGASFGVAPGGSSINSQATDGIAGAFLEVLGARTRQGFLLIAVNGNAGESRDEGVDNGDVIGVGVGEEQRGDLEVVFLNMLDQRRGIGSAVEDRGFL